MNPTIARAINRDGNYTLKLRSGDQFQFKRAVALNVEWIKLTPADIEVRESDICWVGESTVAPIEFNWSPTK